MTHRTPNERAAVVMAAVAALGNLVLGLAHTGITIPVVSRLGPAGNDAVPPAVVAFGVGTAVFAAIAVGLYRGDRWARGLGLAVCALSILSGIGQFRGVVSALAMVLAAALGWLLLRAPRTPAPMG